MPDFTPVPDNRAVGTGNPPQDVNNISDELAAMGGTLNVLNATYAGGADPTGANDSTAAIQAALNAATGGGIVVLPAGSYKISATLTFSQNNTVIAGAGWGTQILWNGTGGTACLAMADTTNRRIFIRDIRLTQSSGTSAGIGIDGSYFQNSVIERVLIDGATHNPNIGVAFNAAGCHYNVLSDSRVNCDGSGGMGVQFDGTANSNVVRNCRILPSTSDATQIGVYVNANSITLDHIDIEAAAGTGVSLGALGHSCTIRDAYMESNGTHVVFASGVSNPLIIGGSFLTPATAMFTDNGAIAPSWINMRSGSSTPFTKAIFQQLSANGQILRIINRQGSPTDVSLRVESLNGGELAIGAKATADSANRYQVDSAGKTQWGPGTGSPDTDLYRASAGVLATDNSLFVGAHALGQVKPSEHGLVAWTCDPALLSTGFQPTTGTQYLCAVYVSQATTVSNIYWVVQTAAGAATTNQNYVGLVNSSGSLLQSTTAGSLDTVITSTGLKTTSITSQAVTPGFYWVVFLFNYTSTALKLAGMGSLIAAVPNVGLSAASYRYATCGATKTDLTNFPITPASNTLSPTTFWAAIG